LTARKEDVDDGKENENQEWGDMNGGGGPDANQSGRANNNHDRDGDDNMATSAPSITNPISNGEAQQGDRVTDTESDHEMADANSEEHGSSFIEKGLRGAGLND
jgi:hypothetical protein